MEVVTNMEMAVVGELAASIQGEDAEKVVAPHVPVFPDAESVLSNAPGNLYEIKFFVDKGLFKYLPRGGGFTVAGSTTKKMMIFHVKNPPPITSAKNVLAPPPFPLHSIKNRIPPRYQQNMSPPPPNWSTCMKVADLSYFTDKSNVGRQTSYILRRTPNKLFCPTLAQMGQFAVTRVTFFIDWVTSNKF